MASVIFWDVDTQYDFMKADGKLYVPDAESIILTVGKLTDYAHDKGIRIVASSDAHDERDDEISDQPDYEVTFPPHSMRGTPGAEKISATALRDALVIEPEPLDALELEQRVRGHSGDILLRKHSLDVFDNPNAERVVNTLNPDDIVLYGVATDFCSKYSVEGLFERRPHTRIFAVKDAMRAIDPETGEHLLREWGDEGVRIIDSEDILEGGLVEELLAATT